MKQLTKEKLAAILLVSVPAVMMIGYTPREIWKYMVLSYLLGLATTVLVLRTIMKMRGIL